jgi:hypothetical protein
MSRLPLAALPGVSVQWAPMKTSNRKPREKQGGKIGYILLWLLGVPIPILLLFFLIRGCT